MDSLIPFDVLAVAVTIGLFVYLVHALLRAEEF